jgi:hypothetical protein
MEVKEALKLKSMPSFTEVETIEAKLAELNFEEISSSTVVSDGRFWHKRTFENASETITVSDEVGDVIYMKDPIITILGNSETIEKIRKIA